MGKSTCRRLEAQRERAELPGLVKTVPKAPGRAPWCAERREGSGAATRRPCRLAEKEPQCGRGQIAGVGGGVFSRPDAPGKATQREDTKQVVGVARVVRQTDAHAAPSG